MMLACAEAFLDVRAAEGGTAWRIADLADGPGGSGPQSPRVSGWLPLRSRPLRSPVPAGPAADPPPARRAAPPGRAGARRGSAGTAAVLLAPLGRLTAAQLTWLADRVGGRPARITPWRSVVLPDLPDAAG